MTNNREYNELEKALEEMEIEFNGCTDGENVSYMVEGLTYTIDCYLDFVSGIYSMETLHKGMDSEEWTNKKEYKKLSTLVKNVLKWADK